ncbi:unnamed protein product [Urochloa humidicola]
MILRFRLQATKLTDINLFHSPEPFIPQNSHLAPGSHRRHRSPPAPLWPARRSPPSQLHRGTSPAPAPWLSCISDRTSPPRLKHLSSPWILETSPSYHTSSTMSTSSESDANSNV